MIFTTDLTTDDHLEGVLVSEYVLRIHRQMQRKGWMIILLSLVLLPFSYWTYQPEEAGYTAIVLCAGAALMFRGVRFLGYYPRAMRAAYPMSVPSVLTGPFEIELDANGVSLRGEKSSSRMRWEAYTASSEANDHFILFLGGSIANVLPKRSMTPDQIEEARALIHEHIPDSE